MQRASSVQTVSVLDTGKIDLAIMPNVSSDWAGYVTDTSLSGYGGVDFSAGFASVAREYQAKTPMRIPDAAECDNCSISVPVSDRLQDYDFMWTENTLQILCSELTNYTQYCSGLRLQRSQLFYILHPLQPNPSIQQERDNRSE